MKRIVTGRWRWKFFASAAVMCCAAMAMVAGTLPAGAASASTTGSTGGAAPAQAKKLAVSAEIGPASPLPASARTSALPASVRASVPPDCALGNQLQRSQACWTENLDFLFTEDGAPVGTTVVRLIQSIQLNAAGSDWTEDDVVTSVAPEGVTAPIEATLAASCDSPCDAVAHFAGVLAVGLTGTVDYTDGITAGHFHTTPTHYVLDFEAPPFIPLNVGKWDSAYSYRCDNDLPGITGQPGCVFPSFIPTFAVSRATYGAAAALIQWAQLHESAHWGLRPLGEPLMRLANATQRRANRRVICNRGWTPFRKGWKHGRVRVGDSCDEFPFAATYESGAMNGVTSGTQCAQLEADRTGSKGSPAQIWGDVKPIGTPTGHEKCVRGHIPLTLNVDLGRDAYLAFIKSQRLLDLTVTGGPRNGDKFWLSVTA